MLKKLSEVQDETNTSIKLSEQVIQNHRDFCQHMHETLQHAATARDHHLVHDSSVIVAGNTVKKTLTELKNHIGTLQDALHDVVQQLRALKKRAGHGVLRQDIYRLWTEIKPVLDKVVEIMRFTMLVISHIGSVLGLFHPVAPVIGTFAGKVHKCLAEYVRKHGHNSESLLLASRVARLAHLHILRSR